MAPPRRTPDTRTALLGALLVGAMTWMPAHAADSSKQASDAKQASDTKQTSNMKQASDANAPTRDQYSTSLNKLLMAAQDLREAIQAMADKPHGDMRSKAIKEANDALLTTQQAMSMVIAADGSPLSDSGRQEPSAGKQAASSDSQRTKSN